MPPAPLATCTEFSGNLLFRLFRGFFVRCANANDAGGVRGRVGAPLVLAHYMQDYPVRCASPILAWKSPNNLFVIEGSEIGYIKEKTTTK
jgi:hypothetical protein